MATTGKGSTSTINNIPSSSSSSSSITTTTTENEEEDNGSTDHCSTPVDFGCIVAREYIQYQGNDVIYQSCGE